MQAVGWARCHLEAPVLVMLAAVLLAAPAEAKELTSGEFRNTADTTEAGEIVLHPLFLPSSAGLAKNLDLKFPSILGLVGGPMLGVEYAVVSNDAIAVSIEPRGNIGWTFDSYSAGGSGRFTLRLGENRLNVSGGALYTRLPSVSVAAPAPATETTGTTGTTGTAPPSAPTTTIGASYVAVPVNVGFDAVASDHTTYRFTAQTDLGTLDAGVPFSMFAANWNHGSKDGSFRLALGVALLVGANPIATTLSAMPDDMTSALPGMLTGSTLVLPAPTFEMWWKI